MKHLKVDMVSVYKNRKAKLKAEAEANKKDKPKPFIINKK